MSLLQLQRTLKFDVDDLRANRDGRMSERQRGKYQTPQPNKLVIGVIIGHGVLITGILGAIAIATGERALWVVLGIVVAVAFIPFVLMQNEANIKPTLKSDVNKGKVAVACGIVILTAKGNNNPYYELYVDGVTMRITPSQASAFVDKETYCVYYLPLSYMLLTAEPTDL